MGSPTPNARVLTGSIPVRRSRQRSSSAEYHVAVHEVWRTLAAEHGDHSIGAELRHLRARLDGIFDARVFVISFVSNVVVAALIVFLGDQLGVGAQLSTAVVVVLGIRIFGNAAAIRRHIFRA